MIKLIYSKNKSEAYLIKENENGESTFLLTIKCKTYSQYCYIKVILKSYIKELN